MVMVKNLDYPALNNEWRTRYGAMVKNQAIPVKDGVIELLEWLKSNNIPYHSGDLDAA